MCMVAQGLIYLGFIVAGFKAKKCVYVHVAGDKTCEANRLERPKQGDGRRRGHPSDRQRQQSPHPEAHTDSRTHIVPPRSYR